MYITPKGSKREKKDHYNHNSFLVFCMFTSLDVTENDGFAQMQAENKESKVHRHLLRNASQPMFVLSQGANALQAHCTAWDFNAWHLALCHFYSHNDGYGIWMLSDMMTQQNGCHQCTAPSLSFLLTHTNTHTKNHHPQSIDLFSSAQPDHRIWSHMVNVKTMHCQARLNHKSKRREIKKTKPSFLFTPELIKRFQSNAQGYISWFILTAFVLFV